MVRENQGLVLDSQKIKPLNKCASINFDVFVKKEELSGIQIEEIVKKVEGDFRAEALESFFIFLKKSNCKSNERHVLNFKNYGLLKQKILLLFLNHLENKKDFANASKLIYRFQFLQYEKKMEDSNSLKDLKILQNFAFWEYWFEYLLTKQKSKTETNNYSEFILEILIANFSSFQSLIHSNDIFVEILGGISEKVGIKNSAKFLESVNKKHYCLRGLILFKGQDLEPATETGSLNNSKNVLVQK